LALAEIIRCVAVKWKDITGGVDGISGIPMPWKMTDMSFYYLTFIFLGLLPNEWVKMDLEFLKTPILQRI
jgi:ABC-type branched-subunit amino acid transport system permease subunit